MGRAAKVLVGLCVLAVVGILVEPSAPKEEASSPQQSPALDTTPLNPVLDSLIGRCAHNRSDGRLLGRIESARPSGRSAMLTVVLTREFASLGRTIEVTFPRNATVRACE